ncbi:MAG: hypothetical protein ACRC41_17975 [Sarcina sp.]
MLKANKSITLNGYSVVEEQGQEVQVAYLSYTIATDGTSNPNTNKTILNADVYAKHRAEVRADISEFEAKVFEIEDGVMGAI